MTGALWILVFTVAVGIILYIGELRWRREAKFNGGEKGDNEIPESTTVDDKKVSSEEISSESSEGEECCGLHLVCEKDSLSPMSDEILYYDDEELDRFIGRPADSYSAEETEEFRDVLMTLRPEDVPGWARSITQRRLELPSDVRDELLILVNEQRTRK